MWFSEGKKVEKEIDGQQSSSSFDASKNGLRRGAHLASHFRCLVDDHEWIFLHELHEAGSLLDRVRNIANHKEPHEAKDQKHRARCAERTSHVPHRRMSEISRNKLMYKLLEEGPHKRSFLKVFINGFLLSFAPSTKGFCSFISSSFWSTNLRFLMQHILTLATCGNQCSILAQAKA